MSHSEACKLQFNVKQLSVTCYNVCSRDTGRTLFIISLKICIPIKRDIEDLVAVHSEGIQDVNQLLGAA